MLDHHALWRLLVANKRAQSHHVLQYIVLKALEQTKGDEKRAMKRVLHMVSKGFSPIKRQSKLDNGARPWGAVERAATRCLGARTDVLGAPWEALGDLREAYTNIMKALTGPEVKVFNDRKYVYTFVRQDIPSEYQLVQAAHATFVAGHGLAKDGIVSKDEAHQIYFTVVGVADEAALNDVIVHLASRKIDRYCFREPDIGNELTAITTVPIPARDRRSLLTYNLLRFNP